MKNADLVVATHGRGFWIGDNLTLLYQAIGAPEAGPEEGVRLFAPPTTYRILPDLFADWMPAEGKIYGAGLGSGATIVAEKTETGQVKRTFLDAGEGALRGAVVDYFLPAAAGPETKVTLTFLDAGGHGPPRVRDETGRRRKMGRDPQGAGAGAVGARAGRDEPLRVEPAAARRGEGARQQDGGRGEGGAVRAAGALPGAADGGRPVVGQPFEVVNDPRVTTSLEDLAAQQALLLHIRDRVSAVHRAVIRLREVRGQVEGWKKRAADHAAIIAQADEILQKLAAIEDVLYLPGDHKMTYGLIVPPRLNQLLATMIPLIASADAAPTEAARELVAVYEEKIDAELAKLETVLTEEVGRFNDLVRAANLPPVGA